MSEHFDALAAEMEDRRRRALSKREVVTEAIVSLAADCNELGLESFELDMMTTVHPVISRADDAINLHERSTHLRNGVVTVEHGYGRRTVGASALYVALGRWSDEGIKAYSVDIAMRPVAQTHRMAMGKCAVQILDTGVRGNKVGDAQLYARTRTDHEFRGRLRGSQLPVLLGEGTVLDHTLGKEKRGFGLREADISVSGEVRVQPLSKGYTMVYGNNVFESTDSTKPVRVTLPRPVHCELEVDPTTHLIKVAGPQQVTTVCQHNVEYNHGVSPSTDTVGVHKLVAAQVPLTDITQEFFDQYRVVIGNQAPGLDPELVTQALAQRIIAERPSRKRLLAPIAVGPIEVMAFLTAEVTKYRERQLAAQP